MMGTNTPEFGFGQEDDDDDDDDVWVIEVGGASCGDRE